eukprot:4608019-Pyramimonas_sp.AAC.1
MARVVNDETEILTSSSLVQRAPLALQTPEAPLHDSDEKKGADRVSLLYTTARRELPGFFPCEYRGGLVSIQLAQQRDVPLLDAEVA